MDGICLSNLEVIVSAVCGGLDRRRDLGPFDRHSTTPNGFVAYRGRRKIWKTTYRQSNGLAIWYGAPEGNCRWRGWRSNAGLSTAIRPEGLIRGRQGEELAVGCTLRGYPQRRLSRVFKLSNFITNLAHATASVTVSGVDDPVVGTTGRDETGEPAAVFRRRRDASIYPILGSL